MNGCTARLFTVSRFDNEDATVEIKTQERNDDTVVEVEFKSQMVTMHITDLC